MVLDLSKQTSKDKIKDKLLRIAYHRLDEVSGMYKDSFGVKFPEFGHLTTHISTRHHMVHRNGFDKDGKKVSVDRDTVENLAAAVVEFVEEINKQLLER
ncbi:MAG: hypothetical protein ACR2GR_11985 [Rhodothermales bacterium]